MTSQCQNCHKRKATENWLGEGSILDYIHGNYQRWCKYCVLKEQIKYAEKIVKNLPKLKRELEKEKKNEKENN